MRDRSALAFTTLIVLLALGIAAALWLQSGCAENADVPSPNPPSLVVAGSPTNAPSALHDGGPGPAVSPTVKEELRGAAGQQEKAEKEGRGSSDPVLILRLVSTTGLPRQDIEVMVYDTSAPDGGSSGFARSDEQGLVEFRHMLPGKWFCAAPPYCLDGKPGLFVELETTAVTRDLGPVTISEGEHCMTGRVVGPEGEPLAGATVLVGQHEVSSGSDGGFRLETCDRGPYRVRVAWRNPAEPHDVMMQTFESPAAEDVELEIVPNQILLTLWNAPTYTPVRATGVTLRGAGPHGRALERTYSMAGSRFRLNHPLEAGAWTLEVLVPGFAPWTYELFVPVFSDPMPEIRIPVMLEPSG